MKQNETVAVCCGTPLIWTFMFSGAEWFCRKCKSNLGMMNAESILATPELLKEKKENNLWFDEIAKDCVPRGCRFAKCEKCDKGEYHIFHATLEEKEASKKAYSKLWGTVDA